jgi:hypothetical protein
MGSSASRSSRRYVSHPTGPLTPVSMVGAAPVACASLPTSPGRMPTEAAAIVPDGDDGAVIAPMPMAPKATRTRTTRTDAIPRTVDSNTASPHACEAASHVPDRLLPRRGARSRLGPPR